MLLLSRLIVFLAFGVAFVSAGRAQGIPAPEIRGFWADGFNPAFKTPAEIDTLIARLQRAHCNAIWAQVRKRGDAYYFSHYEPRATDNRTPGFDPLETLIKKAHAATPPIAVHAWINTCATAGPGLGAGHILAKHPEWRSLSDKGEEYDNEAVKIDPGCAGAAEWTYRVYLDVARHYDVDGIHFDFVRYGAPNWGYAIESVQRFNKIYNRTGFPLPDDPDWQQFRRNNVTQLVRKVYANAVALKPRLIVSAATICWGDAPQNDADWKNSAAYSRVYQDWNAWLKEGILDLACPMTYFRSDKYRDYQIHWAAWIRDHQYHRAATAAVGTWFNTIEETMELAGTTRTIGGLQSDVQDGKSPKIAGLLLYSYGGTDAIIGADGKRIEQEYNEAFYDALPTLFKGVAPNPILPSKQPRTVGIVKGTVLSGDTLEWADNATVTLKGNGENRTIQSGATGFYAFVDVPAGKYTIEIDHEGEKQETGIVLKADGAVTANFLTASGNLPLPHFVRGLSNLSEGATVLLQSRYIAVGNGIVENRAFVADAKGWPSIELRLPKPLLLPLVSGDLITATAVVHKTKAGQTVLEAVALRVVGCTL